VLYIFRYWGIKILQTQNEEKKVLINIPSEVNRISVPLDMISYFYSEYYKLTELQTPLIILDKEKPKIKLDDSIQPQYIEINMIPVGALKLEPKGNIYTKDLKYALFTYNNDGEYIKRGGWLVFERTNEFYNSVPIFKLTSEEPEAYVNYYKLKHNISSCSDIKINSIINSIDAKVICNKLNYRIEVSHNDYRDAYDLYVIMINPVDKMAMVDLNDEEKKRYRYIFQFRAKPLLFRYEDIENVPII